jgi:glycosyltransferase involved in cell wall biosynthesis
MASRMRGTASVSPVYWTYRGSVRLRAERRAIRTADASFLLNGVDLGVCLEEFHADPSRLHLVRNGFPPEFLDRPLETNDPPGVLFLGSWLARKGSDLAIEAISTLLRARPGTPVLLVGTGVETQTIRSEFPPDVRHLPRIVPRFRREDLPDLVRGMSILLFPSRSEGYPLSLVEAMALGIAPVASSIPGVVEVVEDGSSGLLVPSEDASALSAALLDLLRSPERLEALRRGARERVRDASWDPIATSQLEIYRSAIASRRSSAREGSRIP